jgi:multicomponent Na+:H+ antiporter subunit G
VIDLTTFIHLLTAVFVLAGTFFLVLAAIGVARFPDVYHRMHASSKGVTLGIIGLLIASALSFSLHPEANLLGVLTRVGLVIVFQFIANPVGSHMLAKAAHLDRAPMWKGTLSDELAQDQKRA